MPERVVLSFRGVANADTDGGSGYLQRALSIKEQCEKKGAVLCSWSANTFCFDLQEDQFETAVELAATLIFEHAQSEEMFRAGISSGSMQPIRGAHEPAGTESLAFGLPLLSAVMLSRIARPGEVLLDPKLVAARPGELLLLGMRSAMDGDRKVRGARLDIRKPWRKQAARDVMHLSLPPLIGREAQLSALAVPLGCAGILRADPGTGGSRLLSAMVDHLAPLCSLFVTPVGAGREPLGALRRALSRHTSARPSPALANHQKAALSCLLAGEGVDLGSAAELLDALLDPADGRFCVLAADDASRIDPESLEAVAAAISMRGTFRALIRLRADESVPPALAVVPVSAELLAGPLDRASSEQLAAAFVGEFPMARDAAKRWAKRGGGYPLGIREALAEGIVTGELCLINGAWQPRRASSGRGASGAPKHWIERRLAFLGDGERRALTALAVLGGEASETIIDALAVGMGGPAAHSAVVVGSLLTGGWVEKPEPGWLRLTSQSVREVLVSALSVEAARQWNMAASGMLRHSSGPLGQAEAAWHAQLAGDSSTAAELALEAARGAQTAMLMGAADTLRDFARTVSSPSATAGTLPESLRLQLSASLFPSPATHRYPFEPLPPATSQAQIQEEIAALLPSSRPREGATVFDQDVPSSQPISPSGLGARITAEWPPQPPSPRKERLTAEWPPPQPERVSAEFPPASPAPPGLRPSMVAGVRPPSSRPLPPPDGNASFRLHELADEDDNDPENPKTLESAAPSALMPISSRPTLPEAGAMLAKPPENAQALAELAKQALVQGDLATLEKLIAELRKTGEHLELVERMSGFIALGRGAKAEALRKLRAAADVDQAPAQRARTLLAYGVALAATGQSEAAMIEALDAIARTREAGDRVGEEACARFMARLCSAVGQAGPAATWALVAVEAGTSGEAAG